MPLSSSINCRIPSGSHCHPPAMKTLAPGWLCRMARITSTSSWSAGPCLDQGSYTATDAWPTNGQVAPSRSRHLSRPTSPSTTPGQLTTSWSWCVSQVRYSRRISSCRSTSTTRAISLSPADSMQNRPAWDIAERPCPIQLSRSLHGLAPDVQASVCGRKPLRLTDATLTAGLGLSLTVV